uniref:Calpain-1 catalytic subunit-like n=1 Tax=Callorhinchus milii TaxID=7868 RepID=A0A4W3H1B9_CALMI|eukprot:gi/632981696/ref/XP_007907734.1/ PREDICTED: calpain-1 catalytic subunit-like [Callorhinchus milii]
MSVRGITVSLYKEVTQAQADRGLTRVTSYLNQDYRQLKAACLSKRTLFEDPYFDAGPKSLGYSQLGPGSSTTRDIVWLRPKDICMGVMPEFINWSSSRMDICQGELGNCWFLAAGASLTLYPKLLARVVPQHQNFHTDYAGIFHFQFWQYGEWVDVVVDDRLPIRDYRLVFVRSTTNQEFWPSLLEKAYAKLNGSYEALNGGLMGEAFVDFTGGISEHIDLKSSPYNLLELIKKAARNHFLMGTFIENRKVGDSELVRPDGLVIGHAYSVTGVQEIMSYRRSIKLLRLRNPWGQMEWRGRWSERSKEWDMLDPAVKAQLNVNMEDGEFWMDFVDFLEHFDVLEICSLTPDSLDDGNPGKWTMSCHQGSWKPGFSAGGNTSYRDTFFSNPQATVALSEEDDDPDDEEVGCSLLISLMQKHRRQQREFGQNNVAIGLTVFKKLDSFPMRQHVSSQKTCVARSVFTFSRSVVIRMKLPPGEYIIIPSTHSPNQEAEFTLRIFTEKQESLWELDGQIKADNIWTFKTNITINDKFKSHFMATAGQAISVRMVQETLNGLLQSQPELKTNGFSLEACGKMVQLLDFNKNHKLEVDEFAQLWERITQWWKIFTKYDMDHSGTLDGFEMRYALASAGFHLNTQLSEVINRKYMDANYMIDFDSFVSCLVQLVGIFRKLKSLDKNDTGTLNMSYDEWLKVAIIT